MRKSGAPRDFVDGQVGVVEQLFGPLDAKP
jgi:hypothetical protein